MSPARRLTILEAYAKPGIRHIDSTIKAADDDEAIFDGAGNHGILDFLATHHHTFEGLTFRKTEIAIFAGEAEVMGADLGAGA
ncbi:MAG: hypothetical protein ACKV2U_06090 [Bryobacteraceae bacterium]